MLLFTARHCLAGGNPTPPPSAALQQSPQQIPQNYSQFKRMTQHKSVSQTRGRKQGRRETWGLRSLWALHSNLSQSINCQRKYQLSTSNKKADAKVNAADAYPSDTRYKILCSLSLSLGCFGFYQHARSLQRATAQKSQRNGSDCIHTTLPSLLRLLPVPLGVLAKWDELRL